MLCCCYCCFNHCFMDWERESCVFGEEEKFIIQGDCCVYHIIIITKYTPRSMYISAHLKHIMIMLPNEICACVGFSSLEHWSHTLPSTKLSFIIWSLASSLSWWGRKFILLWLWKKWVVMIPVVLKAVFILVTLLYYIAHLIKGTYGMYFYHWNHTSHNGNTFLFFGVGFLIGWLDWIEKTRKSWCLFCYCYYLLHAYNISRNIIIIIHSLSCSRLLSLSCVRGKISIYFYSKRNKPKLFDRHLPKRHENSNHHRPPTSQNVKWNQVRPRLYPICHNWVPEDKGAGLEIGTKLYWIPAVENTSRLRREKMFGYDCTHPMMMYRRSIIIDWLIDWLRNDEKRFFLSFSWKEGDFFSDEILHHECAASTTLLSSPAAPKISLSLLHRYPNNYAPAPYLDLFCYF